MNSYADRLEINLKNKISLLEQIYECDDRIRTDVNPDQSDFEDLDDYLSDMDSLQEKLDLLNEETDSIVEYLTANQSELNSISNVQADRIRKLLLQIQGKAEAVEDIEKRVKTITDKMLRVKRDSIKTSRRQTRVLKSNYAPQQIMTVAEMSSFDTKK